MREIEKKFSINEIQESYDRFNVIFFLILKNYLFVIKLFIVNCYKWKYLHQEISGFHTKIKFGWK